MPVFLCLTCKHIHYFWFPLAQIQRSSNQQELFIYVQGLWIKPLIIIALPL